MMSERELGIIIAKLDALHEDIAELKEVHKDTQIRVSALETFKSWASGAGALCVAIGSFAITHIFSIMK